MRQFVSVLAGLIAGLALGTGTLRLAYADGNAGWDDCDSTIVCGQIVEQPAGSGNWVCNGSRSNAGCGGSCTPCQEITSSPRCPVGYKTCKCNETPDNDPQDFGYDDCITCIKTDGSGGVLDTSCTPWFCPPTSECELVWDSAGIGECLCHP